MINFNQLRVFHQVANNMNFTAAAHKLHITQPAVTAHMKLFEDYCGLKFFKKRGRKIYLTTEGEALYAHTQKIFEYERQIEDLLDDLKDLKRGRLRLGTSKSYARYFMPFLISSFRDVYPHIKIHLDEGSSFDIMHGLLDLTNEVAVIAKVEDHPDICFIPFSQEEVVLILAPEHKLAGKKYVTPAELAKEPIIATEKGSKTRKLVSTLFHNHGISPEILMETSNAEFIKQLVHRAEGISFVVREVAALELQEKKLATVPIKGERIILEVNIAYLKNQPLSPPAQAFLGILLKISPKEKTDQGIRKIMDRMLAEWNRIV